MLRDGASKLQHMLKREHPSTDSESGRPSIFSASSTVAALKSRLSSRPAAEEGTPGAVPAEPTEKEQRAAAKEAKKDERNADRAFKAAVKVGTAVVQSELKDLAKNPPQSLPLAPDMPELTMPCSFPEDPAELKGMAKVKLEAKEFLKDKAKGVATDVALGGAELFAHGAVRAANRQLESAIDTAASYIPQPAKDVLGGAAQLTKTAVGAATPYVEGAASAAASYVPQPAKNAFSSVASAWSQDKSPPTSPELKASLGSKAWQMMGGQKIERKIDDVKSDVHDRAADVVFNTTMAAGRKTAAVGAEATRLVVKGGIQALERTEGMQTLAKTAGLESKGSFPQVAELLTVGAARAAATQVQNGASFVAGKAGPHIPQAAKDVISSAGSLLSTPPKRAEDDNTLMSGTFPGTEDAILKTLRHEPSPEEQRLQEQTNQKADAVFGAVAGAVVSAAKNQWQAAVEEGAQKPEPSKGSPTKPSPLIDGAFDMLEKAGSMAVAAKGRWQDAIEESVRKFELEGRPSVHVPDAFPQAPADLPQASAPQEAKKKSGPSSTQAQDDVSFHVPGAFPEEPEELKPSTGSTKPAATAPAPSAEKPSKAAEPALPAVEPSPVAPTLSTAKPLQPAKPTPAAATTATLTGALSALRKKGVDLSNIKPPLIK